MAKNTVVMWTDSYAVQCTAPATPQSGDPVLAGQIPGVALTNKDTNNLNTIATNGVFALSVKGENNAGNVAVAVGDILYYEAGQTPPVNKDNVAGVRFGYALGAVSSGATTTINVKIGY
jgi:predicted RecA/RadA family phage recombinase